MFRPVAWIAAALALTASPLPGDDSDPIKSKLDKAKATYQEDVEKLRKGVSDSLDKKEEAARKTGNKALVDQIKAAREEFEKKGEVPKGVPAGSYQFGMRSAQIKMQGAYTEAVKGYTKAKQDDKASGVEAELKEFLKSTGLTDDKEPVVISTWAHQVMVKGTVVKRDTFKLYSNGRINGPNSPNTWHVGGGLIVFTWPNPKAPGGAWKDVCNLAADGSSYLGKNQEGATISGRKISDGDADKKK
jgi:hypothetical protein